MKNINTEQFISAYITRRKQSLLHEDLVVNHYRLRAEIEGKKALVIGGAGSIGSSFIKALLKYNPYALFVVDINENGLTELTRDLRSFDKTPVPPLYRSYPVNFNDDVFYRMLREEGPFDIVANFAAHKHVRSEKDIYSITALLENNVLRPKKLLNNLELLPPSHFFCVSTDKAANPVNIMGASKKMMEELIMAYSLYFPVTTARFANVAFSNGSLLDGFLYRLMKRQPFSVPVDVKRYFVSPEESGQICLLACLLGESGDIFFPKLQSGQLTSFKDITEHFLDFLGMKSISFSSEEEARAFASRMPEQTSVWPVHYFSSDTSGEKMFEEFYTGDEQIDLESFLQLGIIKNAPKRSLSEMEKMVASLQGVLDSGQTTKQEIVNLMESFLPGFHHLETGKNLDQKM